MNGNPNIIGHEHALAELQSALGAAKSGNGGIILISGEAGVGKTLVAEECLAGSELNIFTARFTEETSSPYAAIISVLRDRFRTDSCEKIDLGPLSPYLALLLPELGPPPEETNPEILIETITTAFITLARKCPSAFLLDDLQWADNATLELLSSLSDRIHNEPLIIVGTYRHEEIICGNRLRWMKNELRRHRRLREILLEPLSRSETALLAEQVIGESPCPTLVQSIYANTNGLPLFVEQLSGLLISRNYLHKGTTGLELIPGKDIPIPQSVRDAILLKLESLSDLARGQLDIAAVAGTEFDLELIVAMSDGEKGLDELFDRNFIIEIETDRGAFRHALVRTAIINDIPWSKRRSLHRTIANFLESIDTSPEVTAQHWLKANERRKARQAFIEAAEKSSRLCAYWDAAKTLQIALEIWPTNEDKEKRLDTLEHLAHYAQLSGQLIVSEKARLELAESPIIQSDQQRYAEVQRSLALVYSLQGKSGSALKSRETSMRVFQEAGLAVEAAVEAIATVIPLVASLQLAEAEKNVQVAVDLAEKSEKKDLHVQALGLKAFILAMSGDYQQALDIGQESLTIALENDLVEAAAAAYRRMGGVLEYASNFPGAKEAYFTAMDHCQRRGADVLAHDCMGCLAYVLFRSGDWIRSTSLCQQIMSFKDSPPLSLVKAYGTLGLIHAYRGEVKQAHRLIQQSADLASRHEITMTIVLIYWGLALIEEQKKSSPHAEERYKQMLEKWCDTEDRHDAIAPLCSASTFFASNGMESETSLCAKSLSALTTDTANPEATAGLAYALGETSLMNNNTEEAVRQFSQAFERMEKLSIPMDQAQAGFRVGVALASGKKRDEAIRYLHNAYRLARKLGARPLAGQIAAELEALGEAAEERRQQESTTQINRSSLSRRQTEVLRLVATGLTNKEMASKLFLSPRTVEMHVAHILDRLNCRSRSEAVHKAGELGLLD